MAGTILVAVGILVLYFAIRHIALSVRPPQHSAARCGGCGHEVGANPSGLTRCPECGEEYLRVGIVTQSSRARPPDGPIAAAVALAMSVLMIAIVAYIPISMGWPVLGQRLKGNSVYTPIGTPGTSLDSRKIDVVMDLHFVRGHAAYAGSVDIKVMNPHGTSASLTLDPVTRRVTRVDPGVGVTTGAKLSPGDMRALYNAAGLDTVADSMLASEADSLQDELSAELDDPAGIGGRGASISIGSQLPALGRTGGGSTGNSDGAMILVGSIRIPLVFAYALLAMAIYLFLLTVTLRNRRSAQK